VCSVIVEKEIEVPVDQKQKRRRGVLKAFGFDDYNEEELEDEEDEKKEKKKTEGLKRVRYGDDESLLEKQSMTKKPVEESQQKKVKEEENQPKRQRQMKNIKPPDLSKPPTSSEIPQKYSKVSFPVHPSVLSAIASSLSSLVDFIYDNRADSSEVKILPRPEYDGWRNIVYRDMHSKIHLGVMLSSLGLKIDQLSNLAPIPETEEFNFRQKRDSPEKLDLMIALMFEIFSC
jgi:hypothetical protein